MLTHQPRTSPPSQVSNDGIQAMDTARSETRGLIVLFNIEARTAPPASPKPAVAHRPTLRQNAARPGSEKSKIDQ
jgi:hypothetical protein